MNNNGQLLPIDAISTELLDGLAESFKEKHKNCTPGNCHHTNDVEFNRQLERFEAMAQKAEKFFPYLEAHGKLAARLALETHDPIGAICGIALWGLVQGWKMAESYLEAQSLDKLVQ